MADEGTQAAEIVRRDPLRVVAELRDLGVPEDALIPVVAWAVSRHHQDCPVQFYTNMPERCRCSFMALLDQRTSPGSRADA